MLDESKKNAQNETGPLCIQWPGHRVTTEYFLVRDLTYSQDYAAGSSAPMVPFNRR